MRSKIVAAVFLMSFAATPAWAAPTASFTARPVQGSTCVAPCAVHFDAIGMGALSPTPFVTPETVDPDFTREFHSLLYTWNFGDNTAASCRGLNATWQHSSGSVPASRNAANGPIAGHVFCAPGNYTVTLTVTNPLGQTSTAQRAVSVADPQAVFNSANTFCFANSDSNWTGCPLNCAGGDDNCTVTNDYDVAINAGDNCSGADDCANAGSGMRRIYFRRGDTFLRSGGTTFFDGSTPGLVTAFGSGAKPIIQGNLNESGSESGRWTFSSLNVRDGKLDSVNGSDNLTYFDIDIAAPTNSGPCIFSTPPGGTTQVFTLHAYVDVTCAGNSNSNTLIWLAMQYGMFLGGSVDRPSTSGNGYSMRTKTWQHSVMSNTFWNRALVDHWQWRPEHNAVGLTRAQEGAHHNLIADNVQDIPSSAQYPIFAKICNDDACTCIGGGDACNPAICPPGTPGCDPTRGRIVDNYDWIFERNLFRSYGNSSNLAWAIFQLTGGDMTIRDNVVDLRSALTPTSTVRLVDAIGETRHLSGASSHSNYHVFNNTVYSTTPNFTGTFHSADSDRNFAASGCTSGCLDYNNLFVFTGGAGASGRIGIVNGFTQANARVDNDGTDPFEGTMPPAGTTTMGNFVPSVGETGVVNAGRDFNFSTDTAFWNHVDGRGLCRPDSTEWDIGALEREARLCPQTGTQPPVQSLLPPTLLPPQ